jgi:DnaJ-class molecular chaperone
LDIERAADILGVEVDASDEEIERRYRELSKKVHPDQGGSAKLFIQITQAKKTLLSNTEIKESSQKQSTESTSNSKSNNTNRKREKGVIPTVIELIIQRLNMELIKRRRPRAVRIKLMKAILVMFQ